MRASLLGIAASALLSGPAMAEDRASVVILDASGSMWTQLDDGTSRIEVAREVLGDFLSVRDPLQPLGVIAYGHNRKGDCTDIEVLSQVGQQDPTALSARLRSLNPRGKTPLADALRMAATQIPQTSEEADIVLVTDGLETCGGDVCAVAAELAGMGIPVRTHVVGFGLSESELSQISCVAEATGGLVLSTQSGLELADALIRTTAPVIADDVPAGEAQLNLTIRADIAGRPDRLAFRAESLSTGETLDLGTLDFAQAGYLPATLEAGDYRIVADAGELGRGEIDVPVVAGDNRTIYVPFKGLMPTIDMPAPTGSFRLGVNALMPYAVLQEGLATGGGDFIFSVLPLDATTTVDRRIDYSTQESRLGNHVGLFRSPEAPGDYLITFSKNAAMPLADVTRQFVVTFVERPEVTLTAPPAVAPGAAIPVTIAGGMGNYDRIELWLDGALVSRDQRIYVQEFFDNRYGPAKPLLAPDQPGEYEVVYIFTGMDDDTKVAARLPLTVGIVPDFQEDASLAPAPSATGTRLAGYEINSNRGGYDIASTPLDVADPAQCDALCAADPDCAAWTFVKAGLQGQQAMCWTKYDAAEAQQNDCCISGVMADLAKLGAVDQAMTPAGDTAAEPSLGEDIAYQCGQAICMITDAPTGLSFALPQGWMTDFPTLEAYTAGGEAGAPRVTFMREANNGTVDTIVLNPRQWTTFNGPCMDVPMGQLCQFEGEGSDPDVAVLLAQTLRWEAPAPQDADAGHGPDDGPLHDQAAYVCEAEMFGCAYQDEALQYSVMVPPGWSMTEPTRAPEPAEDGRNPLRMTFFSKMEVPDRIVLNPEGWSDADGPCLSLQAGALCHSASGSDMLAPAVDTLRRTLRDAAPRRLPTPEEALAKVMADLATDDPDAAAAMGALLGTAQQLNTGDGQAPDAGQMIGAVLGTLFSGQDPAALPPPESPVSSGVVLRTCSNDAACTFEQPDLVISGALPAGWQVEVAVQRPDLRISTWFTHRDPAGNAKRLGLNQPGNDNCIDTALGQLCQYTPYISTQEENLIARSLGYGMASDVPARLAKMLGEPQSMDAQAMDGLLKLLDGN